MKFLDALKRDPSRGMSASELRDYFTFGGQAYALGLQTTYGNSKAAEPPAYEFVSYIDALLKANGVVSAIELFRISVLAEARFLYQRFVNGRPGDLFSLPNLDILERPWPGGTTGDLIARMELDAFGAGNSYNTIVGDEVVRLRPDWTQILLTERYDGLGQQVGYRKLGYAYTEDGPNSGNEAALFPANAVSHYAPFPDPLSPFRGMSWVTAVVREIVADGQMTTHKSSFLNNAATPNMIVKADAGMNIEKFKEFKALFLEEHEGAENAYKTLFLGGGADATLVGSSMQEMDFKSVQGAGETRIAAASGIHPVVLGLSEGMQGSSLNAGNYAAAKRKTSDAALRPAWRNMAGSLETIVPAPTGARLWYDDRDVPFLLDDIQDRANVQQTAAITIRNLVDAGYEPESVVAAVMNEDMTLLVHSGLFSVQLQEAGTPQTPPAS